MEIDIVEGRDPRTIDKLSVNNHFQTKNKKYKKADLVIKLGYFGVGPWISDKEDCADENAEIKIEVIENDIEPKTEPEFIDLQTTEKSYQVCKYIP